MEQLKLPNETELTVRVGGGPLAVERLFLEDLDRILAETTASLLGHSMLVIVPSRSLRLHLQRRILRHRQRGITGVEITTHHALASRLVRMSGQTTESGLDALKLLAHRFAAGEPALSRSLGHLADGYRSVLTAVRDLIEAGLDPSHLEGVGDALAADGYGVASKAEIERAHATVRVAVKCAAAMDELGIESTTTLLARAESLVRRPETAAAFATTSGVLIYGYSDATCLTIDFLKALLSLCGGTIYLDQPPDPARPTATDHGVRFTRNFTERMTDSITGCLPVASGSPSADVEMFSALGDDAEVREIASRIRRLLDAGVEPEDIGVVARTLEPSRNRIRTHLGRLGIPFSGAGAKAPRHPRANRFAALIDLLKQGARATLERWLEARNQEAAALTADDARLAFHSRGFGRVEDVATFNVDELPQREGLDLPFSQSLDFETAPDGGTRCRVLRRTVDRAGLVRELDKARSLGEALASARAGTTAGQHLNSLRTLVREELDWPKADEISARFLATVRNALAPLGADFPLTADEFVDLLEAVCDSLFTDAVGGDGGGVQILDVIEARGRTFEYLFIMGLDRSRFPRSVREDSVLPDSLRRVLARSGHSVLPDLPLKRDGFVEERFLFAQLLSSSRAITLSWAEIDDDGNARTVSPLVERLRWSVEREPGTTWERPPVALPVFAAADGAAPPGVPRPAYEAAVLAGIHADHGHEGFRAAVEVALAEEAGLQGQAAASLGNARFAVLAEIERPPERGPDGGISTTLGPYFGLIGPASAADPRGNDTLYVTTLGDMVSCPWKTFLARVLRIEPESDPLAALPSIDGRMIGNLAHAVLQSIVESQVGRVGGGLEEIRARTGTYVAWPDDNELSRIVTSEARRLLHRDGIHLPGFERALERLIHAYLVTAKDHDWHGGTSRNRILAAELHTRLPGPDLDMSIGFKADRVDRTAAGLLLTDYKTGKLIFPPAKTKPPGPAMIADEVRSGKALQAAVYSAAAGDPGDLGRYLFIKPDFADELRADIEITTEEPKVAQALEAVLEATVAAWHAGAFFPRLSEPNKDKEPPSCDYCDFSQSCQRGDSSARLRMRSWAGEEPSDITESTEKPSLDDTATRLWFVPMKGGSR